MIVELEHHGFVGFKPIHNEAILISQLIPHGWRPRIQPNNNQGRRPPNIEPFCEWMIFENDQRERFSLLYLSADAVASYSALYQSNNVKPKIVAMIPPPRELVVPWTDITNENEIFARTLLDVPSSIPRYIVLNRKQWSNFPIEICSLDANIELKVWGRK